MSWNPPFERRGDATVEAVLDSDLFLDDQSAGVLRSSSCSRWGLEMETV